MSNNDENNTDAATIGHDPLAWISGGEDKVDMADKTTAADDAPVSGDIVLSGSLGMAEVDIMHDFFGKVLNAHVEITIESKDLSRVDAAGAQLLYAFVKGAEKKDTPLKWRSVSSALHQTADTLGLSDGMGIKHA